ncbi:SHOCT domain-containing protein [Pseudonocardia parietis]|uniref:Membrane protein n=1 Tax=Pseudonocardia parietis TaxID=570936 RepID=A0ABS4VW68_9PSEU|nr:SHOCT domain-containing protein [Pseudonocardia parietis]MBP2368163.1 putative membrane protein [Pseudonocardia parietis]
MFWWNGHMDSWGIAPMVLGWLLVVGLLVVGVVLLVGRFARPGGAAHGSAELRPCAADLLAERYARGEIDDEEFRRRLQVLDATGSRGPARPGR